MTKTRQWVWTSIILPTRLSSHPRTHRASDREHPLESQKVQSVHFDVILRNVETRWRQQIVVSDNGAPGWAPCSMLLPLKIHPAAGGESSVSSPPSTQLSHSAQAYRQIESCFQFWNSNILHFSVLTIWNVKSQLFTLDTSYKSPCLYLYSSEVLSIYIQLKMFGGPVLK